MSCYPPVSSSVFKGEPGKATTEEGKMTQLWWKVKIGSILASPGPTPCQSPSSGRKMTLMDVIVVMVHIVPLNHDDAYGRAGYAFISLKLKLH